MIKKKDFFIFSCIIKKSYVVFDSRKIQRKEKNTKENIFLMFDGCYKKIQNKSNINKIT